MHTILIVEDEGKLLEVLAVALENMGYACVAAGSAEEALQALQEHEIHLILSDLRLPGLSGRDLLAKVKDIAPGLPVVIMTAYAEVKDAVEIIKEGAFDYIVKPFDLSALEATMTSALRFHALSVDNRQLRKELGRTFDGAELIGQSPAIRTVRQKIHTAASCLANVLITGESGTGKEIVAKTIHYSGPRASSPFVVLNSSAIPESLLESELFGHVKGAFTGATANQTGRFAQADNGTLFLDEIGDMPLALQPKILRCLQDKIVQPLGSRTSLQVDARIIAATNHDLLEAIGRGAFRRDLYYRLNVYPIVLPPLRERREDIPLLAEYFAKKCATRMGRHPVTFTAEALRVMRDIPGPAMSGSWKIAWSVSPSSPPATGSRRKNSQSARSSVTLRKSRRSFPHRNLHWRPHQGDQLFPWIWTTTWRHRNANSSGKPWKRPEECRTKRLNC